MSSPLPAAAIANVNANLPQPGDTFQPTVRVMRLYKPGFHMFSSVPQFPHPRKPELLESPPIAYDGCVHGVDHNLSPFLLLPDSFGDIYLGEKFSAYIAIVNGFLQVPFYNLTLSVRLQTATTVIDLPDIVPTARTGASYANNSLTFPTLSYNESADVIVQHVLNELGTHTLRVSVQYCLLPGANNEMKTLRKFYRFNVLQPLMVLSSFREVNNKPMIQCQVTNSTKSPIFIEEMSFVATNKHADFQPLTNLAAKKLASTTDPLYANDILLLQPEESYAFAFKCIHYNNQLVGRVVGYPVIKWCNTMGETSYFRGDDTAIKPTQIPTALLPQPIKFLLLQAPTRVTIYEEFEITIRLFNTTSYAWPIRIDCPNYVTTTHSHHAIKKSSRGAVRPNNNANTISSSHQNEGNEDQEDEFSFEIQNPPPTSSSNMNPNSNNSNNQDSIHALYFTGLTSTDLGSLDSTEYTDVKISLCGTSEGIFELPPVYAVHSLTKEKYSSGSLGKVLVLESLNGGSLETKET